jgi:hypothetical protein
MLVKQDFVVKLNQNAPVYLLLWKSHTFLTECSTFTTKWPGRFTPLLKRDFSGNADLSTDVMAGDKDHPHQ